MPGGLPPLNIEFSDDDIEAWQEWNAAARALLGRAVARLRAHGEDAIAKEVDEFFNVHPPVDPVL